MFYTKRHTVLFLQHYCSRQLTAVQSCGTCPWEFSSISTETQNGREKKTQRKVTSQQEGKVEVASLQRETFFFSRIAPSTEKETYNITAFCYKSHLCCKLKV